MIGMYLGSRRGARHLVACHMGVRPRPLIQNKVYSPTKAVATLQTTTTHASSTGAKQRTILGRKLVAILVLCYAGGSSVTWLADHLIQQPFLGKSCCHDIESN